MIEKKTFKPGDRVNVWIPAGNLAEAKWRAGTVQESPVKVLLDNAGCPSLHANADVELAIPNAPGSVPDRRDVTP